MTGHPPRWAAALQQVSVNGTHLSAEEVVDACLLLALSECVHVISSDPGAHAAELMGRNLRGLGYVVAPVVEDPLATVAGWDTVLAFLGPDRPAEWTPLRSVTATGAVLIVITTPDVAVSALADAVVTVPSLGETTAAPLRPMVFDLLASLVVEAICRELGGRLGRGSCARSLRSSVPGAALHHQIDLPVRRDPRCPAAQI